MTALSPSHTISPSPLAGVVAAAVTPVDVAARIDVPRLLRHVDQLLADGCSYVSVFGTSGEGASLSTADKVVAMEALIASGVDPGRLLPAAMTPVLSEARAMVAAAARLGCRAVLLLPPFFYETDQEGVGRFVEAAAGAEPAIDLVLYHIPALARFGYGGDLVARLSDQLGPRLAGIKDSTGDRTHTLMLARRFPQLSIFTGTDSDLLPLIDAGGAGIIGGLPNINARGLSRMLASSGAEREAAERQAVALLDAVVVYGGPMPLKTVVAERYGDTGFLRAIPPLAPQPEGARADLVRRFRAAGFDFGMESV